MDVRRFKSSSSFPKKVFIKKQVRISLSQIQVAQEKRNICANCIVFHAVHHYHRFVENREFVQRGTKSALACHNEKIQDRQMTNFVSASFSLQFRGF